MLKNLKNKIRKKDTKEVQCVDCGEWFEIKMKNTKTVRCKNCNAIYRFSIKIKNGASS
jgi:DNA-directed RNA polymerase subunit RPC12/RpoP